MNKEKRRMLVSAGAMALLIAIQVAVPGNGSQYDPVEASAETV